MGAIVVAGALVKCPFGSAPSVLKVTSQNAVLAGGRPVATIQDTAPIINISGCGMCSSMNNPQVSAATAAALGVLTPQPCVSAVTGTWIAAQKNCIANGKPCLTEEATAACSYGGTLSIMDAGQKIVII